MGDDVRAIGPSEDVREAPRADLGFGFFAGEGCHSQYNWRQYKSKSASFLAEWGWDKWDGLYEGREKQ